MDLITTGTIPAAKEAKTAANFPKS